MLEHASAAVTLDVYVGLFEDDLDAVADRMDAAGREARDAAQILADNLRTVPKINDLAVS